MSENAWIIRSVKIGCSNTWTLPVKPKTLSSKTNNDYSHSLLTMKNTSLIRRKIRNSLIDHCYGKIITFPLSRLAITNFPQKPWTSSEPPHCFSAAILRSARNRAKTIDVICSRNRCWIAIKQREREKKKTPREPRGNTKFSASHA